MGLGMPKIAKPKAVRNPFVKAIISEPLTIEFMVQTDSFHYLLVIRIGERAECDQPLDDAFAVF